MSNLYSIVEEIKNLDFEELQEINFITSKYMIEKEREKLLQSHLESIDELKEGKLKFSSDFNELKRSIESL